MATKLTATELDAMADYWSQYFQFVLDRSREQRVAYQQARRDAFDAKREENEAEAERRRQRRWERERATAKGRK